MFLEPKLLGHEGVGLMGGVLFPGFHPEWKGWGSGLWCSCISTHMRFSVCFCGKPTHAHLGRPLLAFFAVFQQPVGFLPLWGSL